MANCNLEIKGKIGDVGYKKVFKVGDIEIDKPIRRNLLYQVTKNIGITDEVNQENIYNLLPVILCTYKRKYFLDKSKSIRLTIDNCISYSKISEFFPITKIEKIESNNMVVELKFEKEYDLENIFKNNFLESQCTRFSKYTNGIKLIYC